MASASGQHPTETLDTSNHCGLADRGVDVVHARLEKVLALSEVVLITCTESLCPLLLPNPRPSSKAASRV